MGNWIFISSTKDWFDENGRASILDDLKIPYSSVPASGRLPTPKEIRLAVASMPDVPVNHDSVHRSSVPESVRSQVGLGESGWQFGIEDENEGNLLLECNCYNGSDDEPADFYFDGWSLELAVRVMAKLSKVCGDFFLCLGWNCGLVVTPNTPCGAEWFCDEEEFQSDTEGKTADNLEIAVSLEAESLHKGITDS